MINDKTLNIYNFTKTKFINLLDAIDESLQANKRSSALICEAINTYDHGYLHDYSIVFDIVDILNEAFWADDGIIINFIFDWDFGRKEGGMKLTKDNQEIILKNADDLYYYLVEQKQTKRANNILN